MRLVHPDASIVMQERWRIQQDRHHVWRAVLDDTRQMQVNRIVNYALLGTIIWLSVKLSVWHVRLDIILRSMAAVVVLNVQPVVIRSHKVNHHVMFVSLVVMPMLVVSPNVGWPLKVSSVTTADSPHSSHVNLDPIKMQMVKRRVNAARSDDMRYSRIQRNVNDARWGQHRTSTAV